MKKILILAIFLVTVISFSGCGKLDVIRDYSINSFDKVLGLSADRLKEDVPSATWSIGAPDNTARFVWSKDNSATDLDAYLETDLKPFVDAGLDVTKLPEGTVVGDKLILGTDLGSEKPDVQKGSSALDTYKEMVNLNRKHLKYHGTLDHFGIDLDNGNVFEWAKTTSTNDKDIVFVLNPQPFIEAGVDPEKIDGWLFAKVETMDGHGKKIKVDKLLKPFNLDNLPSTK